MPFDAATFTVDPLALTTPRERLEYLRDFLRGLPAARFNMGNFSETVDGYDTDLSAYEVRHNCGTTACIAGWAEALFTNSNCISHDGEATRLLGLSHVAASLLFYANADNEDDGAETYWDATPQQAANVLDHLIRTGEVDWSKADGSAEGVAPQVVQPIRDEP